MDLKIFDKKILIMCVVVFILGLFARIYTITLKTDFHQDEVLSVILSNYSEYGWTKLPEKNRVFTGKDIKRMMLWNDSSLKDMFSDIWNLYLYTRDDSHSNLYYSILRASFAGISDFDIKQTIYRGCSINLIAYCLSFFFMFKLLALLLKKQSLIPFGLFVAFMNTGAISNVAYLKPYNLQEVAFIIVTYYFIRLLRGENLNFLKPALSIAFAFLSGYYSIIYVGILAVVLFIKNLDKRYLFKIAGLSLIFTTIFYPGYFLGLISYRATETIERFSGNNLFYSFLGLPYLYLKYIFSLSLIIYLVYLLVKISRQKLLVDNESKDIILLFVIGLVWSAIIMFIAPFKVLRYILPVFPILALIIPYIVSYFDKKLLPIIIILGIVCLNFVIAVGFYKNPKIGRYIPFISNLEFLKNNKTSNYLFKEDLLKPVFIVKPKDENLTIGKVIIFADILPYLDNNQQYIFINPNTKIVLNNFYLIYPKSENINSNNDVMINIQNCNSYYICAEIKR
mgnify:CR=1 FL=1